MKLTILFLTLACMEVTANGKAQTITLSETNAPLEKVLQKIKMQTGYGYMCSVELLLEAKPVTITIKDASLDQALYLIFKKQSLRYEIIGKLIVVKIDDRTLNIENNFKPSDIKGRVTNEKGESVEGVTVTIKGTKILTYTNANGEFSIVSVENEAILVFSSVNMETFELKINGKTDLEVTLTTKVTALGDVTVSVNTGYQHIPKERATGSFVFIDNKTINQQAGTNILKRLDGVSSGLLFNVGKSNANPQNKTNISIRGLSTINGPLDPLIVLDGFIYEGDINNINPNDVENITILKDAAATSIWGARAGNGVIVITTKKGKLNQKLQISINANIIANTKSDLFKLPQISSSDYIGVEQFLYTKGVFNSLFTNNTRPAITPAVEIFRKRALGQISSSDSLEQINALKSIDSRDQYEKYFYTKPITQQYTLNLRGGDTKNAYSFSVGYDKSLSELYSKFKKLNVHIENIYHPIKGLQLNLGVYFTKSEATSGRLASYNSIKINNRIVPYLRFADDNGSSLSVPTIYRSLYTDTAGNGKLLNWKYYPLEDYKHDKSISDLEEFFTNLGLNYKVFKFLDIDIKYQYQKQKLENNQIQDIESFNARNAINLFSQLNRTTGIVKYIVPPGGIKRYSNSIIESQTARGQLNFNHTLKNSIISAIFGGEIRQMHSYGNNSTFYGYNSDPLSFLPIDFVNRYPIFTNGSTQTISGSPSLVPEIYNRFVSLYTNVAYSLRNNYILSFSARRDGSNIFGVNTNVKWKPLWSTGLSWNISNEDFYKLNNLLPNLKIRATYGYSGNVDLRKSAVPVARTFTSSSTNFPAAFIITLNNPELRWEQVSIFNLGLDFSSKREILSGSIEYYHKIGTDLYGPTPYDYTTWGLTRTIVKNVANMKGNGVDVILNSRNLTFTSFKWLSTLLFNYNVSKTTEYFGNTSINDLVGAGTTITPVIGKPLYAVAAYKWGGLDNSGNPQGYVNGQKSTNYTAIFDEAVTKGMEGNITYFGSASPTSFGSLINTFVWKNFSLSLNISYKFGYYFRKNVISYSQLVAGSSNFNDYSKRWQKPGDELTTNVPSFSYPVNTDRDNFYALSEINILKADHVRLQYINLGYSIENNSKSTLPFKEIQVYINASNLGLVWVANKEKLDPEYFSTLPPAKSFAFGIRANF